MVIDTAIAQGEMSAGIQTVFNILFMPASVLNLAYIVFRPMITQMAIVWNPGENRRFLKILGKIIGYLLAISIVLMIGSALLGIPVLSIVYAVDLSAYKSELLVIMVGGCVYTFAAVLDNACCTAQTVCACDRLCADMDLYQADSRMAGRRMGCDGRIPCLLYGNGSLSAFNGSVVCEQLSEKVR